MVMARQGEWVLEVHRWRTKDGEELLMGRSQEVNVEVAPYGCKGDTGEMGRRAWSPQGRRAY